MFRNGFIALIAAVALVGCSAADTSLLSGDILGPGNTTGDSISAGSHGNTSCWGIWEVTIDPEDATCDIVPIRHADFAANVTMFLQEPAGSTSYFMITNLVIDMLTQPGYTIVDCDVGLRHPFPGLDQFTGFDVLGVFMHDEEFTSGLDSEITWAGPSTAELLNSDGFTRWMNYSEFTTTGILGYIEGALGTSGLNPSATLNPYKYFADDLEAEDELADFFALSVNLEKRGYFRPGEVNVRHYQMIWPEGPVTFQYAVVASWELPDQLPPTQIPDDFPIEANCAESFLVSWSDNESTAFYEDPGSYGGDLLLKLEVFDWGVLDHGTTIADEIGDISFESLGGIISSPVIFDPSTLVASPGTAVSSVFDIEILGVQPTGLYDQRVICRVTSAIQDSYDYGLGADVPDGPLAAYIMFDAPVRDFGGEVPTAVAEVCTCLWIAPGGSVTFDGSQSSSPNGAIIDWEWDFDGNGTFDDPHVGLPEHPTYTYTSSGQYDVNLRVTDEAFQTDTLDPDEILTVHVGVFTPPTADAFICPTIGFIEHEGEFEGSGSTGTIDLYEWDFEGDCIWDYEHPTIGDTTHAYTVPDIYDAVLRVTGNGCDSVETEVRMIDPLGILENGNYWDGEWGAWVHGHGGVPYATYIEELVPDDIFRHKVHFLRTGTSDGGVTWIRQVPGYDVTGFDELYFNIFFYIDWNTLNGDGWMGGEMAMAVRIVYRDADSNVWQAWIGWDDMFDGTWQWNTNWLPAYVTYHSQEQVALDTWHERKTIDLMTIDPQPVEIIQVLIGSYGWTWETYVGPVWFSEE